MDRDEWVSWTQQEATIEFFKWLKAAREETKEAWAMEAFVGKDIQSQAVETAAALGGIRVIDSILNKEFLPDEPKRDTP